MIHIQNLQFSYNKQTSLFTSLSFKSNKGSIVGLLGRNGAGKSTLLKLMAGLQLPDSGIVKVCGDLPYKRNPKFLQSVYFVPEVFSVPPVNIQNYLKAEAPLYPDFDYQKMDYILDQFELDKQKKLTKMSYGQQKKFLIAFALSTNSKLLLLDEPTNGLDIPSKAIFRKILAGEVTDEQLVIISTHQVKDVENLIDRITIIENGSIVFNHSIFNILKTLAFYTVTRTGDSPVFYKEEVPGGYRILISNQGEDTPLDIELLFKAVISGVPFNIEQSESDMFLNTKEEASY